MSSLKLSLSVYLTAFARILGRVFVGFVVTFIVVACIALLANAIVNPEIFNVLS